MSTGKSYDSGLRCQLCIRVSSKSNTKVNFLVARAAGAAERFSFEVDFDFRYFIF